MRFRYKRGIVSGTENLIGFTLFEAIPGFRNVKITGLIADVKLMSRYYASFLS